MSKELKALERIGNIYTEHDNRVSTECDEDFAIIETALKRLEEIDNKSVCFVGRTRGQTKRIVEELSNHPEVKVTNLDDQKKLKAFEIIKEYFKLTSKYGKVSFELKKQLPEDKYELLKELLK